MFDPTRVRAVLFDLDGTLIETDNQIVEAWGRRLNFIARVFRRADGYRVARWVLMRVEGPGNTLVTVLDRTGLDRPIFGLGEHLQRWRGLHGPATAVPVAGMADVLRTLAPRYPLALVTTRGRRMAHALLTAAGLDDLLTLVVTRDDTPRMKPDPAPVLFAARTLGVAPEACVMVGDTTVDMLAGRRAGAQAVGVLCGFGERAELERAGAQVVLESTVGLGGRLAAPQPPQGV